MSPTEYQNLTAQQSLFRVTEEDVVKLTEEEFNVVWAALGTIARARARVLAARSEETS